MQTRLVAYDRLGARRGVIPDPLELTFTPTLNELTTVNLHYARSGKNSTMLDNVPELAVERWDGTTWVELRDARLRHLTVDFDHLQEVPTRRYDFIGVGESLKGVLVYGVYGLPTNKDGNPQFKTSTAGRILATIWDNAVSRGWTGFSYSFSPTADSNGQPWSKSFTISYSVDQNLLNILQGLVAQGLVDFYWQGRTLHVYNAGTYLAREKSTGASPIKFDGGLSSVDAAPETEDVSNLATHVVVLGENKLRWEFPTGTVVPEGRREIVLSYSGVDDVGTAQILAAPHILRAQNYLKNTTRQFHVTDNTKTLPFETYYVGDWVQVLRGTTYERMRIYSINLQRNANGLQGYVQLGDRIDDLLQVMYARIQGLTGGVANEGGTPPAPTGRIPAAPTGLVVSSDVYIDKGGVTQGILSLSWAHSGKDTNGETIVLGEYDAYYRRAGTTAWYPLLSSATTSGTASPVTVYDGNLDLITYEVKVIAESGAGLRSAPSSVVSVLMEDDTTAPFKPTTPTASTWLRTVTINWDGMGLSPSSVVVNMPPDFDYVKVWEATNASMTGASVVGVFQGMTRTLTLGPKTADVDLYYALSAVDYSGNESVKTPSVKVTPKNNVNITEAFAKVGYDMIADQAIRSNHLKENSVGQLALQDQIISLAKLDTTVDAKITKGVNDAATADGKAVAAQTAADAAQAKVDTLATSGANLAINGDLEAPIPAGTSSPAYWSTRQLAYCEIDARARSGAQLIRMAPTTTVAFAYSSRIEATAGRTFYFETWVRLGAANVTTDATATLMFAVNITRLDGSTNTVTVTPSTPFSFGSVTTAAWTKMSGSYTVTDANATNIRVAPRGAGAGNSYLADDLRVVDFTEAKSALDAAAQAQTDANQAISDAAVALSSASGKNTITNSTANASSGIPGVTSGDRWQKWTTLSTGGKLLATWRWNGSTWIAEAMDPTYIPLLDIGAGTFGSLNGDRLVARSVRTSALTVTDLTNFAPSLAESPDDWSLTNQMQIVTSGLDVSGYRFQVTDGTSDSRAYGPWRAVNPGESLWMGATLYRASGTVNVYLRYEFADANKIGLTGGVGFNYVGAPQSVTSPSGTRFEGAATVPAGAAYARWYIIIMSGTGSTGFYNITGRRRLAGELIIDGTVTSDKVATNGIIAKNILVGDFQNFAIGSDFEDATAVPWALHSLHTITTSQKKSGTQSLRLASSASISISPFTNDSRVKEGEQWYVKMWAYIDSAFNGASNSKLRIGNATTGGTFITALDFSVITRSSWQLIEATVTVPAGCTSLKIELLSDHTAGFAYVDDIQIRRVSEASLIMNLGVEKLTAGTALLDTAVVNKFYAEVVSSRRIGTDLLLVGRGVNGIVDEFFEATDIKTYRDSAAGDWGNFAWSAGAGVNMYTAGSLTAGTSRSFYYDTVAPYDKNSYIPVEPDQRWLLKLQYTSGASGPRATVRYIKRDGTTGYTSVGWEKRDGTANVYEPAGSIRTLERIYRVPSDVAYIMPAVQFDAACTSATVYGGATLTNMATSSLIVDGTITALKIDLNDLSSDTGFVGSMRTNVLTSDVITSTMIHATNGITAKHTITGATIQTVATALRGIKINSSGMIAYDSLGNQLMNIGNGSQNLLVGDFMTSRQGTAGVRLINSSSWGLPAIVYSYNGNQGAQEASSFMRYTIGGVPELVHRAPDKAIVGSTGLGFVRVEGDLVLSLGNGAGGSQQMRVEQPFNFDSWSPVDGYHQSTFNAKIMNINAVAGNLKLDAGAYYVQMPSTYARTSGSAGNLVIASDGGLFRSTSASKYKILPEVMDVPDTLLDVPVKNWIDRAAAEEFNTFYDKPQPWSETDTKRYNAISLKRIPGAIAEDVEAAGGSDFVVYGEDGQIEGLMYDRYALARTDILGRKYTALLERVQTLEDALGIGV